MLFHGVPGLPPAAAARSCAQARASCQKCFEALCLEGREQSRLRDGSSLAANLVTACATGLPSAASFDRRSEDSHRDLEPTMPCKAADEQ